MPPDLGPRYFGLPKKTVPMRRTPTPWPKKDVGAAAGDMLTYHGGPLLANVEVTAIYWGAAWASDALRTQMDEFFAFVVTSSLMDQLAEYSQPGFTIGHGRFAQSLLLATDEPPSQLDDSVIQERLDQLIATGAVGAPTTNSVHFVFLPPGVTATIQGATSCQQFCGYHNRSNSGVVYVVDTYDDCQGCQFGSDTLSSSTIVASHELCEAITDPQLNGWYSDISGEEIGDLCAGSSKVIGDAGIVGAPTSAPLAITYTVTGTATAMADGSISGNFNLNPTMTPPPPPPPPTGQSWTVQREWSNAQGACA